MTPLELINKIGDTDSVRSFLNLDTPLISLEGCRGSLLSVIVSLKAQQNKGIHLVVMDDKDSAGYFYNDTYNILGLSSVAENLSLLMPSSYKRSIATGGENASSIAARTAVLNAITEHIENPKQPLIIATYAEALVEKVISRENLKESILNIKVGEKIDIPFLESMLQEYDFERTDFVSEPGQYVVRGGIIDLFSFASNKPYRVELLGNEVESLRSFTISTQLSDKELNSISIVPNLKSSLSASSNVSLLEYIGERCTVWLSNAQQLFARMDSVRSSLFSQLQDPTLIDNHIWSSKQFLEEGLKHNIVTIYGDIIEREPTNKINFKSTPQPIFNKNFELLAQTIKKDYQNSNQTYILSDNFAQIERLENIFAQIVTEKNIKFEHINLTLHSGFCLDDLRVYTDHQIFDRHHKYKIHNEIDKSESLTITQLGMLKLGDYVVHMDYGVGRFGGLVRTSQNGVTKEFIKLNYKDNDTLMVAVHNLHKISKYKSGDTEVAPTVHKLGGTAWAKIKANTKRKIKDIAKELIELYAKRKASEGYAFSRDSYLQQELESSFMYEDTEDQVTTNNAVKMDMESSVPMDRLICGDVGFGKTEIAIRAAFKAVVDGKQVAVLVPTTVLSLQHYRTFSKRLKEFPVRIENLSRAKSNKQVTEILNDLKAGKIDILIGTHKILGKSIEFKDLGLLIIDEEQKFGVSNKEKLRSLKTNVDTLTLTATPIPRTLQFSLMGARDMSLINTPPSNRQPIDTEVMPWNDDVIKEAIEYELSRSGQLFIVHNRVKSIEAIAMSIRILCPEARVAVGHGQMPPADLEKIMMDFIYGEYDILVATTIIESGIDIPNANTIIINNAQNFGLSDLHQLRGRVGRTNRKAFCYLIIPSADTITSDALRRLRAIEEFSDLGSGFNIAMQDLDIRGAGNILGGEQSGFVADIGFETYQKIINETVAEIRYEQGLDVSQEILIDCHIESDLSAYLPDDYIGSTAEKIRLYRQIDNLKTTPAVDKLSLELTDRFGVMPSEAQELMQVVKLRIEAEQIAIERIVLKKSIVTLFFAKEQSLPFYKGEKFTKLLQNVIKMPNLFKLDQKDGRVLLSMKNITSFQMISEKLRLLQQ